MADLDDQNVQAWQQFANLLDSQAMPAVLWVTCDQHERREKLLNQLDEKLPAFQHFKTTAWGYHWLHIGGLQEFFEMHFELQGGRDATRPAILHVTTLEAYMPIAVGKRSDEWLEKLAKNIASLVECLPFRLVLWSGRQWMSRRSHSTAPAWMSEVSSVHFESRPITQRGPKQYWRYLQLGAPYQPKPETPYLQKLLVQLAHSANLRSTWACLAMEYRSLGNPAEELKYRLLLLPMLPEDEGRVRTDEMYWIGDAYMRLGEVDKAAEYFWQCSVAVTRVAYDTKLYARIRLAETERILGKNLQSMRTIKEALALSRIQGNMLAEGRCLRELAEYELRHGSIAQGLDLLVDAIKIHILDDELTAASKIYCDLAEWLLSQDRLEEALRAMIEAYMLHWNRHRGHPSEETIQGLTAVSLRFPAWRRAEVAGNLYDSGYRLGLSATDASLERSDSDDWD